MERGGTSMVKAQPAASRVDAKVDGDVVSRFATCCRALGIAVYDRQRPADLAAAREGFTALTRVAHDQCDAWAGWPPRVTYPCGCSRPFRAPSPRWASCSVRWNWCPGRSAFVTTPVFT